MGFLEDRRKGKEKEKRKKTDVSAMYKNRR
jgi:hypothetical protein